MALSAENNEKVLAFFAEGGKLSPEELQDELESLRRKIFLAEKSGGEWVERLQARLFVKRFPLYLKEGIMKWVELETRPIGRYEEPGARRHFLRCFSGLVAVYEFKSEFQGRSNSREFKTPGWLTKAIKMLKKQGWDCELKPHVFAECGVGNTLTVYLCVRDPRLPKAAVSV